MPLIELSMPVTDSQDKRNRVCRIENKQLPVDTAGARYTGMIYDFEFGSMAGTYVDFPGHIKELNDGKDAANYPLEKLFRIDAAVIRLDKPDRSGEVTAEELKQACETEVEGGALIVNALGGRRYDAIEERSVYFSHDAIGWIVSTGIHLIVSDIYESKAIHGVFYRFFENGISTVCLPVNMHLLTQPKVKLTVLPLPFPNVTQLPCRVIAETE